MHDHPIILFDGVCNLCSNSVQFVINHDKKKKFHFSALQSVAGKNILVHYGLSENKLHSFVLIKDGKAFTESTAALMVAKHLSGPVRLLYGFIIVPLFIRNAIYKFIAKNRYHWFGKKESCMVPSAEILSRFLND